jgi:hypothetical protein
MEFPIGMIHVHTGLGGKVPIGICGSNQAGESIAIHSRAGKKTVGDWLPYTRLGAIAIDLIPRGDIDDKPHWRHDVAGCGDRPAPAYLRHSHHQSRRQPDNPALRRYSVPAFPAETARYW